MVLLVWKIILFMSEESFYCFCMASSSHGFSRKSSYLPAISFLLFYLFFSLNTSAKIVPIEFFPKVLFLVALFFAFALNASILFINQFLNAYKINGILASIVVLIMHVYSGFWNYRAPLALIFGYEQTKNYLFISLIIAISSALFWVDYLRTKKLLYMFISFVLYISLYASLGRLSLLNVSFVMALSVLFYAFKFTLNALSKFNFSLSRFKIILFSCSCSLVVILLSSSQYFLKILERFDSVDSLSLRAQRASEALTAGTTSFLGSGTYYWYPEHPHNFILQIFGEGGIIGVFLSLLFILRLVWGILSVYIFSYPIETRLKALAVFIPFVFTLLEYSKGHQLHSGILFWIPCFLSLIWLDILPNSLVKADYPLKRS